MPQWWKCKSIPIHITKWNIPESFQIHKFNFNALSVCVCVCVCVVLRMLMCSQWELFVREGLGDLWSLCSLSCYYTRSQSGGYFLISMPSSDHSSASCYGPTVPYRHLLILIPCFPTLPLHAYMTFFAADPGIWWTTRSWNFSVDGWQSQPFQSESPMLNTLAALPSNCKISC